MAHEPRVLLYIAVEQLDDPQVTEWLNRQAAHGFEIERAVGHEAGRAALEAGTVSVLALDSALGRTPCLFLLREGRAKNPIESAYIVRDDTTFTRAGFSGVIGKEGLATLELDGTVDAGVAQADGKSGSTEAKQEFLSRIAQDIRTPLHGIHGALDLLDDTGMSPMQKDYAKIARDAAFALMSVVNDLTDHASPGRSRTGATVFPFEPRTCLERIAAVMGPKASSKGLGFILRTHFDAPWRVEGDPNALREILNGLSAHLIRHTSQGNIVIGVRAPDPSDTSESLRFFVGVEDADCEIDVGESSTAESRAIDINDAFFESYANLAQRFGGNLQRDRTEPESIRFEITIPFKVMPDELPPTNIAPETLDGREVLVVDDSVTNRAVHREQLANWGCNVAEASSGPEALSIIDTRWSMGETFDIAVIDFVMEGMDGAELAQAIRALPNGADMGLILCTSNPRGGDAARMTEAGFDAYLTKPVRFDCLSKVMCLLLDNRGPDQKHLPLVTQHVIAEMDRAARSILYIGDGHSQDRDLLMTLQQGNLSCDVASLEDDPTRAVVTHKYGAILLDCRADLDGALALAHRIRREEEGEHVPLVAVVSQHDADCHVDGINEVLADPVHPDELRAVLRSCLGIEEAEGFNDDFGDWGVEDAMDESEEFGSSPINMDRLEEITAGDAELRQELVEMFIRDTEERFSTLESAIVSADAQQLNRTAHSIKGSCANMGAQTLQALAFELESMGSEGRFDDAPERFADLKNEFEVVKVFFGTL